MNIATSSTREKYPLSYKKILKKTIGQSMAVVLVILVVVIALPLQMLLMSDQSLTSIFVGTSITMIILGVILVAIIYFYQRAYFAKYYYECGVDYVTIRKGVFSTREVNIPYERIQDVYVDQDIIDRMLGLYDVHISSATASSGMSAHIDGVEKAAADGLRTVLLDTVKKKIGRKA